MEAGLLQGVRQGCKAVAERARFVRINHEQLPAYAASLPLVPAAQPLLDPACHYLGHGEATVAFLLTLDTINFGSGYFPHLRKPAGLSGYFTIASALTTYYREHGPLSATALAHLTAADCARIFGQDVDREPIGELMQRFATACNDLGHYLLARFHGHFLGLVEAAGASAERLVQLLRAMPSFNDVARYEGLEVPFYKRAQLTAADLALAFAGQGASLTSSG